MARYFFHSVNGGRHWDRSGVELSDNRAARIEAVRLAGAVLNDEPELLDGKGFRVEVTDIRQQQLFMVVTLVIEAIGAPVGPVDDL